MSEKKRYDDEPLGNPKIVPDFLPRPEDLVFRDEGVKVTIALSRKSVDFFKREAQRNRTQYQRMIRRLLDAYAEHHLRAREDAADVDAADKALRTMRGARSLRQVRKTYRS